MNSNVEIHITSNFERNLDEIEEFMNLNECAHLFIPLIDELFTTVIPNIERFPDIGVNFLSRTINSVEVLNRIEKIKNVIKANKVIREYLFSDYLLLYLHDDNQVYLLSIKHHRQLKYDTDRNRTL